MTAAETKKVLISSGAIKEGHFRLSSGLHSSMYVQCALVLQHPERAETLTRSLAERLAGERIDVVAAPALGGVIFGYELARQLSVRAIFSERDSDGRMTFRRGFALNNGERVLVAEDVVTTGGSVREMMEAVRAAGGEVVAVAALVDRSGGKVDFGVRLETLLIEAVETYSPDDCPLCRQGVPISKPGSRPATG